MEFIFGTLATDDLKLIHHRTSRRGVQHGHRLNPRDPGPGEFVTVTLHIGPDVNASYAACYYTLDGSEPTGKCGVAHNGEALHLEQVDVVWDTLAWGYITVWQCILPDLPEGAIVRYRLSAWSDNGGDSGDGGDSLEVFANWPDVKATVERAADAFFREKPLPETIVNLPTDGNTFTYHVDRLSPPEWAREAVIYQILVDRFYPGDGREWQQSDDLKGFFGGTLWGVRDKIDYIAELGATCIWLSPTFDSPSHHGYDVTDYYSVEPRLGGEEALRALVKAAHERGIRVMLDLVCNHISNHHPTFQAAHTDPSSSYRDWFTFDDSEVGHRAFFGVPDMPEIDVANPAARKWLLDIARFWIREFDVDGYRLDHASGPGPDFWADFRAACKAEKNDFFCFGEIVEPPDVLQTYIGRLDGCLDFISGDALRKTFGYQTMSERDFERFLSRHLSVFPDTFLLPTFIDNHDMDRFLFIAGGDKEALRRAAAAQMRLPGPPIIYYGTEVGLSQKISSTGGAGLEQGRLPMVWGDEQDGDLLAYYKSLIQQRVDRMRKVRGR